MFGRKPGKKIGEKKKKTQRPTKMRNWDLFDQIRAGGSEKKGGI